MVGFPKFVKKRQEERRKEKEIERAAFKKEFVPARKRFLEQRGEARAKARASRARFGERISGGVSSGVRKAAPVFGRGIVNIVKSSGPRPSKVKVVDKPSRGGRSFLEVRVVNGPQKKKRRKKRKSFEDSDEREKPPQQGGAFDIGNIRLI